MSLSPLILSEICRSYGIAREMLKPLNACYSDVFEYEINNRSCIVKIKEAGRTSEGRLNSEVLWLNYLKDNGVSVAYPIRNRNGNYIKKLTVSDGVSYFFSPI